MVHTSSSWYRNHQKKAGTHSQPATNEMLVHIILNEVILVHTMHYFGDNMISSSNGVVRNNKQAKFMIWNKFHILSVELQTHSGCT